MPAIIKARLHRRFLSRQLDAIFVALKLQLKNCTCKRGAIFSAICRRDIAGGFEHVSTCCNFIATKIASSCRDKNHLCKRAFMKPKRKRVIKTDHSPETTKVDASLETTCNRNISRAKSLDSKSK